MARQTVVTKKTVQTTGRYRRRKVGGDSGYKVCPCCKGTGRIKKR